MADVKMSEMTADSSVAGTEKLLALDGTTSKTMTAAVMAAYAIDVLAAASATTATSGDYVLMFTGASAEKRVDVDDVVSYTLTAAFDSAAVTAPSSGDFFLLETTGTPKTITATNLATYMLTNAQSAALTVSTLSEAGAITAATDCMLIWQPTSPKYIHVADVETQLWTDFATYTAALTDISALAAADRLYVLDGGTTPKYTTPAEIATYVETEKKASIVDSAWDPTPGTAYGADILVAQNANAQKTFTVTSLVSVATATLSSGTALGTYTTGDLILTFPAGAPTTPKLGNVSNIAEYVFDIALAKSAISTVAGTDKILAANGSNHNTMTVDALKTYVLTGIQTTALNISGLSEAGAITSATDSLLIWQSTTAKYVHVADVETQLWADFKTYVGALTDITTVDDSDYFYAVDGAGPTAKKATALELATYVIAESWTASAAASVTTGDYFLSYRTGTGARKATVDQLSTWLFTSAQTTILDIDGLSTATLGGTDYMPVQQGTGTGDVKKTTVAALATYTMGTLATYVASLNEVDAITDADLFYTTQGGTGKYVDMAAIVDYVESQINTDRWMLVSDSTYTATPASTSTITFSDTTGLAVGMPIKYTYSSTTYYGIITAVSEDALVTIAGATLSTGAALTALYVSSTERALQVDVTIGGTYDGGSPADILSTVGMRYFKWQKADAYLVKFSVTHATADTGANQPYVNVKIGSGLVSTANTNKGLQLSTAGAWVDTIDSYPVAISTSNYDITQDAALEISLTAAGSNNDAAHLTVSMVFVYE